MVIEKKARSTYVGHMVHCEFAAAIIGRVLAVTTHNHDTNDFFGAV